nr:hypothetical protein GCM10020092_007300 [Actinoplanes digitatis]
MSSAPPSGPTSSNDCGRTTPLDHHDFHPRADQQLVGDVERVGDHGELGALAAGVEVGPHRERPGHLGHGGAAVEADDRAGHDQVRRRLADALLLRRVLGALVAQRQVIGDAVGDRATPGPGDHLLLAELVEVPADGRLRDVELVGRVLDADPAALREQLKQRIPPRVPVHPSSLLHVS